jgi:hypothetical protein
MASFVQDMGVDHCRANVFMPQKLLNGSDVITGFKQMRGKRMAERVTADVFYNASFSNGFLDSPLKDCLVYVVATFLAGLGFSDFVLFQRNIA